jgi:hypothetical protein
MAVGFVFDMAKNLRIGSLVTALSPFKDAAKSSLRASVHNKKIYVWMYAESNVRR